MMLATGRDPKLVSCQCQMLSAAEAAVPADVEVGPHGTAAEIVADGTKHKTQSNTLQDA